MRSRAPVANSISIAPGVVIASGPGAIVTGANTAGAALQSCCRHRNNWLATAPGLTAAATIRSFSALDHRGAAAPT